MADTSPNSSAVHVDLGPRSYDIVNQPRALDQVANLLEKWTNQQAPGSACLISDTNLLNLYASPIAGHLREAGWKCEAMAIPAGEPSKSLSVLSTMYDTLATIPADRQTIVIAVGGGVVGDAAGFAAATYNRGLRFVQIPTSLLAMVDSSVGGKVGINLTHGKNLVGAFHQPFGVIIDPNTLKTLPPREFRSGLAEIVKYGVILDPNLFEYLEHNAQAILNLDPNAITHIVNRSCQLKAHVVEQDELELTGLRAILNYGHTFAHAYEALAGYGTLTHGEAVSIGMVHASRLAAETGRLSAELVDRQRLLLEKFALPTTLPPDITWSVDEIINRMRLDKKNKNGQLRFILPTRIGNVELVDNIAEEDVRRVLQAELNR